MYSNTWKLWIECVLHSAAAGMWHLNYLSTYLVLCENQPINDKDG